MPNYTMTGVSAEELHLFTSRTCAVPQLAVFEKNNTLKGINL